MAKIEILGTESLGVRSLCCAVEVKGRKIVIDPGVALGYKRHGLLPHPVQVAVGARVRLRILAELEGATDVVISHFHGDHVPLPKANPYQLSAQQAAPLLRASRLWAKGSDGLSIHMGRRRASLAETLGRELPNAEGQCDGPLTFSRALPHGEQARPYFQATRAAFERLSAQNLPNVTMRYLSMGMSNSYPIAIEEGANVVRIGTKIFGPRPKRV